MRRLIWDPEQLKELLGIPFTDEQVEAITAPLEPGVIVAGAGSGKTTVMAARVVWLVGTGQVAPEAVLGLTFTNKAAGELAQRVRQALLRAGVLGQPGGDAVGEPTISTYHAFAGRLVQEHGLRIGIEPTVRLLADATRFQLAARVVRRAEGPFPNLTKPVPMLVADLIALDGELSEHLVTTEELRAHDEALLAEIEALSKPHKPVLAAAEAARKRIELSRLVDAYRAAKRELDLIDFGDQVAFAATLAEQRPEVGAIERDRYAVVLLDEYQDTSVAQRRLLTGLFGPPHHRGHPVTAVGDPCQAIYGWRGASVANLDEFPEHFPRADGSPARRYSLSENRRSGGVLLRFANDLAAPLRELHSGVQPLRPKPGAEKIGAVRCALLDTYEEEVAWVADQVARLVAEGVPPKEIAVLVRAGADFPTLYEALVARDVPVEVVGLGGLLHLPEVADLVATLQVLNDPTANAALVRLLIGPRWRIGPRDLALLGRRARELVRAASADDPKMALEEAVAGVDPTEVVSLAEALEDLGDLKYSPEARARFTALAAELRELRRHACEPLLDLIHRVVTVTGLDVELAANPHAQAARRRESLNAFLDVAAAFADLDGDPSLTAFLAFLRASEAYDRGLDNSAPTAADSVKLLTAHKSKGLEWDVVVVPNLSATVFPSGKTRDKWTTQGRVLPHPLRGDAASLPMVPEWTAKGCKVFDNAMKEHAALEELRLGYVTFTRPRRLLVASGHWWGPTQKRRRGPSVFLQALRDHCIAGYGSVDHWAPEPPEDAVNPLLGRAREYVWPRPYEPDAYAARRSAASLVRAYLAGEPVQPEPDLSAAERALVEAWDRDLDSLLTELREQRARERLVPLPPSLSASQLLKLASDPDGLARELARPMPRQPRVSAQRGIRFHAWVESLFGQRPLLEADDLPGAADEDIATDAELTALQEAFLRTPYAERQPHAVEVPFQLVLAGRVIRGRIDAVYRDGDGFEIVDWKTNREQTADPLQLAIYRLAWAELAGVPLEKVGAAFLYVRTGDVVRPENLPGRAELERLLLEPSG
ncbi:ATP-dependent DNA helicase [Carbonactinospora thermoautotrophica]|uniref:ATP-dependent DNA helicase n=1 Tax=Carbonactinospora thermoautotrophica TaxID=1469144 RepID=UPI00226DB088|nr:ATP-dependent DNA helicase [Carbonactinospora thermoautotrophica]MCX9192545.1 ATP-dependent DNA helicase [Carbonactinospora thermoautotrophica]